MSDAGKLLMVAGAIAVVLGAVVWGLGRAGFHGLPGDIRYDGPNTRFYFPIVTCIMISILLSAAMWFWRWISGR
jgi:hypothetical protein